MTFEPRWESPRRILIAPDKFKGTLSASAAVEAIAVGVRRVLPDAELRGLPFADGGEGTVEAVIAAGGSRRFKLVEGPRGTEVDAAWAVLNGRAVIELAASSGLQLTEPTVESARSSSTKGLGQLISAALDDGFRSITVGLGGSASTDGGAGALQAMGVRFFDTDGAEILNIAGGTLSQLTVVDVSGLDSRLAGADITLCCDVESPLLGEQGAAAVFAPQKGADPATVEELEEGLAQLAHVLNQATGRDGTAITWGGAAGGTAAGLYAVLGAGFVAGVDELARIIDVDKQLKWADLLIVGEGKLDAQSFAGKAPIGLARRARPHEIEVIAVAGAIEATPSALQEEGISHWASARDAAPSSADAMGAHAAGWVSRAAQSAVSGLLNAGPAKAPLWRNYQK